MKDKCVCVRNNKNHKIGDIVILDFFEDDHRDYEYYDIYIKLEIMNIKKIYKNSIIKYNDRILRIELYKKNVINILLQLKDRM